MPEVYSKAFSAALAPSKEIVLERPVSPEAGETREATTVSSMCGQRATAPLRKDRGTVPSHPCLSHPVPTWVSY